jgi:hypothetical protein
MKTSESVVHPISPEHPLVVGDEVKNVMYGPAKVIEAHNLEGVIIQWQDGTRNWVDDKTGINLYGWEFEVTRISHAPTPEPNPSETLPDGPDTQKADLLEEADRVNPRLMQATDEQIDAERERRANFPERRIASIKKEMLARYGEAWFKMMLKDFENQVRIHTRECILAEQEGGSHE